MKTLVINFLYEYIKKIKKGHFSSIATTLCSTQNKHQSFVCIIVVCVVFHNECETIFFVQFQE